MIRETFADVEAERPKWTTIYELEHMIGETGVTYHYPFLDGEAAKAHARWIDNADNEAVVIGLTEKRYLLYSTKEVNYYE